MTWLVWRQHRKQLLFGVAALVVLAAFFVGTGRPMHDRFERDGLHDCLPQAMRAPVVVDLGAQPGTAGQAPDLAGPVDQPTGLDADLVANGLCAQAARAFYDDYENAFLAGLLLLVLPMLVGMFWGAPLVAREIEHGTHRLVWTQAVSRGRWAAIKIGFVSITVLVLTAIYAAMLSWWISPVIRTSGQRLGYIFFDTDGTVVFGYVMFALALGVFAGAVTGRLLPAMTITLVGFLGVRLLVMLAARNRYLPTETRSFTNLDVDYAQMRNDLAGDWIVAVNRATSPEVLTVHPARHFWAFQAIETAIFGTLAVGLVAATIYWVRRRTT
jgi:hypothetical protein